LFLFLDFEVISKQTLDGVVAADPCKYDHASLFELLQRRTLQYRLNDVYMNMVSDIIFGIVYNKKKISVKELNRRCVDEIQNILCFSLLK